MHCGNKFTAEFAKRRYCNDCKGFEHRRVEPHLKTCLCCGREFIAKAKHRMYCPACPESVRIRSLPTQAKTCLTCGKKFVTKLDRHKQCAACLKVARKMPQPAKPCKHCGENFVAEFSHRLFCPNCPISLRGTLPDEIRSCANCGEQFLVKKGIERKYNPKFCPTCRAGGNKVLKGSPRECVQCREIFRPCRARPNAKLCSHACRGRWMKANELGPSHNSGKLLEHFVAIIREHANCLSQEDLMELSGTTAKVLRARGWTMQSLYNAAGREYTPPELCSYLEDRVYHVLREIVCDLDIEFQKMLPGMVGVKGWPLRADFFVERLGLIVEADGPHHRYDKGGHYPVEYTQANDRNKDAYAAANGILLVRIAHTLNRANIKKQLLQAIKSLPPPILEDAAVNLAESTDEPAASKRAPLKRQKRAKRGSCNNRPFQNRQTPEDDSPKQPEASASPITLGGYPDSRQTIRHEHRPPSQAETDA